METFTVTVVTPDGGFLEKKASLLELPTEDGEIGIYPGHVPLMAALGAGEMRLYHDDTTEYFALAGGFLEVRANGVRLLAAFAAEDEGDRIDEAVERARVALEDVQALSEEKVQAELTALRSELVKLSEIKKSRSHRG